MTKMQDKKAYDHMVSARSQLLMSSPFFGCLILQLKLVEVMNPRFVDTMVTDGTHLFYHPAFVHEITERQRIGVIAHEGYHCAYQHHARMGARDPRVWNHACDYIINLDLKRLKFQLPDGILYDTVYAGLSSEEVYTLLQKKKQQDKGGSKPGKTGKGGKGGSYESLGDNKGTAANGDKITIPAPCSDPGGIGGVIAPAPVWNTDALEQERVKWETIARQAVNVAKAANAGTVPGFLERLVQDLNKPKVDWENTLRRFVDDSIIKESSWQSPSNRHLHRRVILPGPFQSVHTNHIVSVMDTSGSVTDALVAKYASEKTAILDEGLTDRLTVIYVDADVQGIQEFERGDEVRLNPKGNGGTNFKTVFELIKRDYGDASVILFFTDLCATNFGKDPGKPVLWLCYENSKHIERWGAKVPFGEIVQVED